MVGAHQTLKEYKDGSFDGSSQLWDTGWHIPPPTSVAGRRLASAGLRVPMSTCACWNPRPRGRGVVDRYEVSEQVLNGALGSRFNRSGRRGIVSRSAQSGSLCMMCSRRTVRGGP